MVTTIQLQESVKSQLEKLKAEPKETYEEVIKRLIREQEIRKRKQRELLIEGYKEMAEESLKICEEFKYADAEVEEALRRSEISQKQAGFASVSPKSEAFRRTQK